MGNKFEVLTDEELHNINGGFTYRELGNYMVSGGVIGVATSTKYKKRSKLWDGATGAVIAGFGYSLSEGLKTFGLR